MRLKIYNTVMRIRQWLGARIVSQFMHPRGLPGRLVGWEMALRPSNRKRNVWAVSLMDVQPSDRVLEIGFGPGIAVRELARRATRGQVVGIDRSAVMRAQAARRNAAAIHAGRVSLTVASLDDPPALDRPFDKILAVNNMGMWLEPGLRLKELAGLLRGGGLIAIVSQPRCPGATAGTTAASAQPDRGSARGRWSSRDSRRDVGLSSLPWRASSGRAPRAAGRSPARTTPPRCEGRFPGCRRSPPLISTTRWLPTSPKHSSPNGRSWRFGDRVVTLSTNVGVIPAGHRGGSTCHAWPTP